MSKENRLLHLTHIMLIGRASKRDNMTDEHKRRIKGWGRRGHEGKTCACCREVEKAKSSRLARRRLKQADKKEMSNEHVLL